MTCVEISAWIQNDFWSVCKWTLLAYVCTYIKFTNENMLIFLLILTNPCIARGTRKEIGNERLCCANISVRNKISIYEYSFTGIIFMQKDIDIFLRIQYVSTQINLRLKQAVMHFLIGLDFGTSAYFWTPDRHLVFF